MARKGARDDREVRRSLRKGERELEVLERGLARIERKLVKAQVILTETTVRASDLEEKVRALRAKLGLPDDAGHAGAGRGRGDGAGPVEGAPGPVAADAPDQGEEAE